MLCIYSIAYFCIERNKIFILLRSMQCRSSRGQSVSGWPVWPTLAHSAGFVKYRVVLTCVGIPGLIERFQKTVDFLVRMPARSRGLNDSHCYRVVPVLPFQKLCPVGLCIHSLHLQYHNYMHCPRFNQLAQLAQRIYDAV